MLNAEHTLTTAIEQLERLNIDRAASLDDLVALSAARDRVDELFRACTDELRADPQVAPVWSAISSAIGLSSKQVSSKQRSSKRKQYAYGPQDALSDSDERVVMFWDTFAEQFAWDFLPVDFLHALYEQWMTEQFPQDAALPKLALTRRLKTAVTASGDWSHVRSRPGSLMDAAEPLKARAPRWTHVRSDDAIYGLRRSGV